MPGGRTWGSCQSVPENGIYVTPSAQMEEKEPPVMWLRPLCCTHLLQLCLSTAGHAAGSQSLRGGRSMGHINCRCI